MNINLPKEKLKHWENFKKHHSEGTAAFVSALLGKEVEMDFFVTNYCYISASSAKPSAIRNSARKQYKFLLKHDWIKMPAILK